MLKVIRKEIVNFHFLFCGREQNALKELCGIKTMCPQWVLFICNYIHTEKVQEIFLPDSLQVHTHINLFFLLI